MKTLFLSHMKQILFAILLGLITASACKKNTFITGNANVTTSTDSLHFDTLFTTTGSVTQFFRIYNQNNQKLRISEVSLGGGNASFYRINVDGYPGPIVRDLEVEANDSLYVFVTVNIDPGAGNLPFVVQDSVHIKYNDQEQWVQLDAWGQNAHFYRNRLIDANETWTNDRPYVILGGLLVDENVTLTIEKGTRIYLHADAPFFVDGTIKAIGGADEADKIIFRGDRLDAPYKEYPAAWPGIYFREPSRNNELQYTEIRNAYQGLVLNNLPGNAQPKLSIKESIIDNCFDAGILSVASSINAENCLISNCGKNIMLVKGGNYQFTHCTVAAYTNTFIQHKEPLLLLTNFLKEGSTIEGGNLSAAFTNCIFWADNTTVENEVITQKEGNASFNVDFTNCILKAKTQPANVTLTNILLNQAPDFETIDTQKKLYNFRLKEGSPAINAGVSSSINIDLDGKPRPVGLPDLGCYEKQ